MFGTIASFMVTNATLLLTGLIVVTSITTGWFTAKAFKKWKKEGGEIPSVQQLWAKRPRRAVTQS